MRNSKFRKELTNKKHHRSEEREIEGSRQTSMVVMKEGEKNEKGGRKGSGQTQRKTER